MKLTYFAVLAFLGGLAFLILFIADREREASVERLSDHKIAPRSAPGADPGLKR
jgi:hypothetical protein